MTDHLENNDVFEEDLYSFRNSLGTADKSGKRKWVYPKKPKGVHYDRRTYLSWILIALMVITPWIKIGGAPLFKFDIINREFYIFSYPFFTSDFKIFALSMISTMVFIILFTVVYGRIFCGWICPQTIFLEMVFRKIEYAIEGDRNKQIKLDKQDWNEDKIKKRAMKWGIYFIISFILSNVVFTWIYGSDGLLDFYSHPAEHITGFFVLLVNTAIIYFVFTWFREQACVIVCPYGRFQGVLIDKKTIIVAYDYKRGEREKGRGRFKRGVNREEQGIGDCIDCGACVAVCPTGIDIRNGTQLECVNCTACIDACDEVMDKIKLPRGLVRYASEENIAEGRPFKFNARMIGYTAVLTVVLGILASFIFIRSDVDSKFLREPGTDYKVENGNIINQFQIQLQNKTKSLEQVHLRVSSHEGGTIEVLNGTNNFMLQPGKQFQAKMLLSIPSDEVTSYKERIEIEVLNDKDEVLDSYRTSFAAPFR